MKVYSKERKEEKFALTSFKWWLLENVDELIQSNGSQTKYFMHNILCLYMYHELAPQEHNTPLGCIAWLYLLLACKPAPGPDKVKKERN